jgi:hypothetical protein
MEIDGWMRSQIRNSVVDMMVERALIEQKLATKKIEVTDDNVMEKIKEIAEERNMKLEDVPTEIATIRDDDGRLERADQNVPSARQTHRIGDDQ